MTGMCPNCNLKLKKLEKQQSTMQQASINGAPSILWFLLDSWSIYVYNSGINMSWLTRKRLARATQLKK